VEHQKNYPIETVSRDVAALVLVMLGALAILSFVLAGLRISEIRAGATAEPSVTSPLLRAFRGAGRPA
jgi:hypothetical protein